jgi:CBS domain-containing protein
MLAAKSSLNIAESMSRLTTIKEDTAVSDALKKIRASTGFFAVVNNTNRPQALLRDEYLSLIAGEGNLSLAELSDRLPRLVTVEMEVGSLNQNQLKMLVRLLQQTKAPGVTVLSENTAIGFISRGAIANALSSSAITSALTRDRSTVRALYNASCFYRCSKCNAVSLPFDCSEAPDCPTDASHGTMDEAKG